MMQQRFKRYSDQDLIDMWKAVVRKNKKIPLVTEFIKEGLPPINYYNKAFGNYSNFKIKVGVKNVVIVPYRKKTYSKRFFRPKDWYSFLNVIENPKHKFHFEFLLHTGMRYNEAKKVKVQDIEFENNKIKILFPKGGKMEVREIPISDYMNNRISGFIKLKKLGPNSNLGFPSNDFMDKQIKRYCEKSGMSKNVAIDYSCHNLRKTLEMYGVALNINAFTLAGMLGHTVFTANQHYVSDTTFTSEEKVLIRSILDNLWM